MFLTLIILTLNNLVIISIPFEKRAVLDTLIITDFLGFSPIIGPIGPFLV